MKLRHNRLALFVGLVLTVVAALALVAQDKYTSKVPGGLAFSEFRGYESWETISVSRTEKALAVILGNPAMINAYRAGFPGSGKPAPDGAKMGKVHWAPKPNEFFKDSTVPGTLVNVNFMVKDSKRFADSGGWAMQCSITTPRPTLSSRAPKRARPRRGTTPNAGLPATQRPRREITFSPITVAGEALCKRTFEGASCKITLHDIPVELWRGARPPDLEDVGDADENSLEA